MVNAERVPYSYWWWLRSASKPWHVLAAFCEWLWIFSRTRWSLWATVCKMSPKTSTPRSHVRRSAGTECSRRSYLASRSSQSAAESLCQLRAPKWWRSLWWLVWQCVCGRSLWDLWWPSSDPKQSRTDSKWRPCSRERRWWATFCTCKCQISICHRYSTSNWTAAPERRLWDQPGPARRWKNFGQCAKVDSWKHWGWRERFPQLWLGWLSLKTKIKDKLRWGLQINWSSVLDERIYIRGYRKKSLSQLKPRFEIHQCHNFSTFFWLYSHHLAHYFKNTWKWQHFFNDGDSSVLLIFTIFSTLILKKIFQNTCMGGDIIISFWRRSRHFFCIIFIGNCFFI